MMQVALLDVASQASVRSFCCAVDGRSAAAARADQQRKNFLLQRFVDLQIFTCCFSIASFSGCIVGPAVDITILPWMHRVILYISARGKRTVAGARFCGNTNSTP